MLFTVLLCLTPTARCKIAKSCCAVSKPERLHFPTSSIATAVRRKRNVPPLKIKFALDSRFAAIMSHSVCPPGPGLRVVNGLVYPPSKSSHHRIRVSRPRRVHHTSKSSRRLKKEGRRPRPSQAIILRNPTVIEFGSAGRVYHPSKSSQYRIQVRGPWKSSCH